MRQLKIIKQVTKRDTASLDKYLQEIAKVDLINPQEEVELATKIKKGDMKAHDKLIKGNLRFVVSVAKQYQNQGLSLPDLINEGNLGLIKAARRFDETKGFKFISYAVWWIRQSILQALAENARIVRLPLNKIGSINKINQTFMRLIQEFEREPSAEEIAKELDLAPRDVKDAMLNSSMHISMDAPIGNDEDAINLYDILINSDDQRPDSELVSESLKKEIERLLNTLNYREAEIIRLYFGLSKQHPYTLEEIGEKFDLTRERVRQIKGRTLKTLQRKSKILKSYL
jgi:RNA polymerase primary sigma factor